MDGTITIEESKSDGRLKVGVSTRNAKKKMLKNMMGRGGPSLSSFKSVGYGKVSFPKATSIKSVSSGSSKKIKLPSSSSLIKSLLKGTKPLKGLKVSKAKVPEISKIKKMKIKTVKGLVTSYK